MKEGFKKVLFPTDSLVDLEEKKENRQNVAPVMDSLATMAAPPSSRVKKELIRETSTASSTTGDILCSLSNLSLNDPKPKKGIKRPQKNKNHFSGLGGFFMGEKRRPQENTLKDGLGGFLTVQEKSKDRPKKKVEKKKNESRPQGLASLFLNAVKSTSRSARSVSSKNEESPKPVVKRQTQKPTIVSSLIAVTTEPEPATTTKMSSTPDKTERAAKPEHPAPSILETFDDDPMLSLEIQIQSKRKTKTSSTPEKTETTTKLESPAPSILETCGDAPMFSPEIQVQPKRRNLQKTPANIHQPIESAVAEGQAPIIAVPEKRESKKKKVKQTKAKKKKSRSKEETSSAFNEEDTVNNRSQRSRVQPDRFIDQQGSESRPEPRIKDKSKSKSKVEKPNRSKGAEKKRERAAPERFGDYVETENHAEVENMDCDSIESDNDVSKRNRAPPNRFGMFEDSIKINENDSNDEHSSSDDEFDPVELAKQAKEQQKYLPKSDDKDEGRQRKAAAKSKLKTRAASIPTKFDQDEVGADGWTQRQISQLRDAHGKVDPTSDSFWYDLSIMIPGDKTANECQTKWFSLAATPANTKVKRPVEYFSPDEDDVFNSTPMRGVAGFGDQNTFAVNSKSILGDFGSAIKIDPAYQAKNDSSDDDDILAFDVPRQKVGYKSYLTEMRRAVNRDRKPTRKKKAPVPIKERKKISEYLIENGVEIDATLSPGGTFRVAAEADDSFDEDMSDESEC